MSKKVPDIKNEKTSKSLSKNILNSEIDDLPKNLLQKKKKRSSITTDLENFQEVSSPKKKKCLEKSSVVPKVQVPTPQTEEATPSKSGKREEMDEISENAELDPVEQTLEDIFEEMDKQYTKEKPLLSFDYMSLLPELDPYRRVMIIEWLMEFSSCFGLKRKTFHQVLTLFDIYSSKVSSFLTNELQIVAAACLMIAVKNEEVENIEIKYYVQACCGAYDIETLKNYEVRVLKTLNWKIHYSNIFDFSEIVFHKWEKFMKDSNFLVLFDVNDVEKLKVLYYYFIDVIVLNNDYKQLDLKELIVCILYVVVNLMLNTFSQKFNEKEIQKEIEITGEKYYSGFFESFLSRNKSLNIKNFDECFPFVQNIMDKEILDEIFIEIESLSPEKIHFYSLHQDFKKRIIKIIKHLYIKNYKEPKV